MSEENRFNLGEFNHEFEEMLKRRLDAQQSQENARIGELNRREIEPSLLDQSIGQTLFSTKDAVFDTVDDLLDGGLTKEMIMKEHRMYYLGIALVIVTVFLLVFTKRS